MALLLTSEDVEQALDMQACLEALEESFKELAEGIAVNRPRSDTYVPTSQPEIYFRYKTFEGAVPGMGVLAQRMVSERIRWPLVHGMRRQDKFQRVYPNQYVGVIFLFDIETGKLLAIIKESYLQKMRVGATSGLGVKFLARDDCEILGLLGSGWQAGAQIEAACAVRKIKKVKVFSPNPQNRRRFAEAMSKKLDVEVAPVEHLKEAVLRSDIVMLATNSMEPVFGLQWCQEGMHISSINKRELEPQVLSTCDLVVSTTCDSDWSIHVGGPKEGVIPLKYKQDYSCSTELGEVILGRHPGRTARQQKTLFFNHVGLGTQFAAVGSKVYEEARSKGIGKEIPDEYFLETSDLRIGD